MNMEGRRLRTMVALREARVLGINTTKLYRWTSGEEAPLYINLRLLPSQPKFWIPIIHELSDFFKDLEAEGVLSYDMIAAVESGATLHAGHLAAHLKMPTVKVAKQPKGKHGVAAFGPDNLIEGGDVDGRTVVVFEDVCSTGKNVIRVAEVLRAAGAIVTDVVCMVSHLNDEVLTKIANENSLTIHTLLPSVDLVRLCHEGGRVSLEEFQYVKRWLDSRVA